MKALESIAFHGQDLIVATDDNGIRWVAIRPICEGLGIQFQRQQHRIQNTASLDRTLMYTVGADGANREMFCIPVSQLNAWLYSISANKVHPEARAKLLLYQSECQAVLFNYFMPQGGTMREVANTIALAGAVEEIRQGLNELQGTMRRGFSAVREEVDELRELIHIAISDHDETEIRNLIHRVKSEKGMDGRAIVGHVRKTLGTSGVYASPNLQQVKNVLRNLLGVGVLGSVPFEEATRDIVKKVTSN